MVDTNSASTVNPDIADALEALYQDITLLLDRIIQQLAPWEVQP
ncbi:MAG: hypothetical protein WCR46_06880 [Deltaproteobacteria bacterium]